MATEQSQITLGMMISEVRREIGQRNKVYPRLVESGRMMHQSELQIAIMEKVLTTLEGLREQPHADGYGVRS